MKSSWKKQLERIVRERAVEKDRKYTAIEVIREVIDKEFNLSNNEESSN